MNVLVIKLQGTNRQDKESLKFFRDSGGNIVAHFPPENEPEKHKELKQRIRSERQLTATIGVASNKLLSKIASDHQKPDGLTLISEAEKYGSRNSRPAISWKS